MHRLEDKVTVVTGASSGIGRAIALAYAGEGAHVAVICNESRAEAEAVATEIRRHGREALVLQTDLTDPEAAPRLVDAAKSELGRIDVWVNNAGADILTGELAGQSDHCKLAALVDTDLKGTIYCCWAVAALMQEQGSGVIINMSWDQTLRGFPGTNPQMFSAVKAGVQAYSMSLARTLAPAVRVNVLAPGWIATDFATNVMEQDYYAQRIAEIPLGRFGLPEEVATAAVFLASAESAYITGATLKVGGGAA